jgi:hypothetical protein
VGWFLRKALSFGPLRLNFSKSGIGFSFGVRGARIGVGPRGKYFHAGRHGIYFRQSLEAPRSRPPRLTNPPLKIPPGQETSTPPIIVTREVPGLPSSVSKCGSGVSRLATERPECWEYLLFAEALEECLGKVNAYRAIDENSSMSSAPLSNEAALDTVHAVLDAIGSSCTRLSNLVNTDFQAAIGPSGQPADLDALVRVAHELAQEYDNLLDVRHFALSLSAPDHFTQIKQAMGKSALGISSQVAGFPERIREGISQALENARAGIPQDVKLSMVFQVDEADLSAATKTMIDGARREMVIPG